MANTTLTNLPTVTSLNGSEPLLGVQAGSSVQITTGQIASLAAGTSGLPFSVSSGGTGRSSFTPNGIIIGNGTGPLGVTAAGATGQVLIGNTGGAPTWSSTIPSTAGVTSISLGTTGLTPTSATTGPITIGFGSTPTDAGIYSPAAQQIALSTASVGRLFITATGNVGVGTDTPFFPFTVKPSAVGTSTFGIGVYDSGSGGANTAVYAFTESFNNDGYGDGFYAGYSRGTNAARLSVQSGDGLGYFGASGWDGAAYITPSYMEFLVDGAVSSGNVPTAILFRTGATNPPAPTERMRITSAGNVGISTSVPASLLHVDNGTITTGRYGNFGSVILRSANGTQASPTAISVATTLSGIYSRGYDGSAYQNVANIQVGSDGAISNTSSPGFLSFATTPSGGTTSSERMRITSAGNVGIGTTTPAFPLDVAGEASATGYGASGLLYIRRANGTVTAPTVVNSAVQIGRLGFLAYDGSAYQYVSSIFASTDGAVSSTDSAGRLIFQTVPAGTTTLTERMRIRSDGNIGIGTAGSGIVNLLINNNITGGTTATVLQLSGPIQSGVTNNAYGIASSISSAAAAFTTTNVFHFIALPSAGGAGSIITNQTGFRADASIATAGAATVTNAFGFSSGLTAAANSWNFYANGTANNAFAGNVRIGSVVAPTVALDVTGVAASTNWYNNATQTATNTATLSAAQITSPFLLGTPTATASYTLPLASAVDTALGTPPNETGWEFVVFTTAAFSITLLTNTGWTLVGSMATGATANSFARFRARKTGTAAYTLYRIS